jgi:hypothetical protein
MCICMYACMYTCVYVSMYLSVTVSTYSSNYVSIMYLCMNECIHACMYLCIYVSMYQSVCVSKYLCMHLCMYVCIYVCMYACMHVHSIYVCIYVCVYVYMHACMLIVRKIWSVHARVWVHKSDPKHLSFHVRNRNENLLVFVPSTGGKKKTLFEDPQTQNCDCRHMRPRARKDSQSRPFVCGNTSCAANLTQRRLVVSHMKGAALCKWKPSCGLSSGRNRGSALLQCAER